MHQHIQTLSYRYLNSQDKQEQLKHALSFQKCVFPHLHKSSVSIYNLILIEAWETYTFINRVYFLVFSVHTFNNCRIVTVFLGLIWSLNTERVQPLLLRGLKHESSRNLVIQALLKQNYLLCHTASFFMVTALIFFMYYCSSSDIENLLQIYCKEVESII